MSQRAPRTVSVGGTSVAYWDTGSGAPLVFVHGYFLSARPWRKVIPGLEADYRCIAIDLMGAGDTEADPNADFSIPAQARILEGLLDALRLPRVTLIAHDSGAVLTRTLAANQPTRVASLVLSDTEIPECRVRSAELSQKLFRVPGWARVFERSLGSRFFWGRVLPRAGIYDLSTFDSEEFIATHMEPLLRSRDRRRASRRFAAQWDLGFVDSLPHDRLMMPKLVLWGDHDHFIPLERARAFYDALPEPKQFACIANSGTLPHEEQPVAWLASVRHFLSHSAGVVGNAAGAA